MAQHTRRSFPLGPCTLMVLLIIGGGREYSLAEFSTGATGSYVQTVMDSAGSIDLAFMNGDFGSLLFMHYDGEGWTDPGLLPSSTPSWPPFTNPDIAVGPDRKGQLVYGVKTGDFPNDLDYFVYARSDDVAGTSFTLQYIGNDGARYDHCDIAVDEFNLPHICYGKSSEYEPWWWEIMYRGPSGSEYCLSHATSGSARCLNPCIAYRDGTIHVAWIQLSEDKSDLVYATGTAGGSFTSWQVTSHSPGEYVIDEADIGVTQSGQVEIYYLATEPEGTPPNWGSLYVADPYGGVTQVWTGLCDGPTFGPNVAYDDVGTTYVVWTAGGVAHINGGSLGSSGHIDVCAGPSAYYFRVHEETGEIVYDLIGPFAPYATIDSIIPSPVHRGIDEAVALWGTASDTDANGEAIVSWEWSSNLDGALGSLEDIVVDPLQLSPGEHTIRFTCRDDEGVVSAPDEMSLLVLADTIPPPPVDAVSIWVAEGDTVVLEWLPVEDNLALDCYELHRHPVPWFVPDIPMAVIDAEAELVYRDGTAVAGEDSAAYYLIIPRDVDGNENADGRRIGVMVFSLELQDG